MFYFIFLAPKNMILFYSATPERRRKKEVETFDIEWKMENYRGLNM